LIVTASQFQSTAPIHSISIVQTSFTRSAHRAYAKPSEHDLVQETMGAPVVDRPKPVNGAPCIRSTRAGSALRIGASPWSTPAGGFEPMMRPPAEIGIPLEEVESPALILDLDTFERNLKRLADAGRRLGVRPMPRPTSAP